MSLARVALRIAAVEALRGRTRIGANVLDSQIGILDVAGDGGLRTDEDRPFLAVYTDAGKSEGAEARNLRENGEIDLVFVVGVMTALTEIDPETGAARLIGLGLPGTDAAFEFLLDLVDRQITAVLTDPANEWSEIWRKLVDEVVRVVRRRDASAGDADRLAAREIRLTVKVKADPLFNATQAEGSVWSKFRAKLASDRPELAAEVEALFGTVGADLAPFDFQRMRGANAGEARALGFAPHDPANPGATIKAGLLAGGPHLRAP
ncbi:hypothetical protein [Antarcticirhabdus aurantiaca]|uniref:hypothetical protein n=1 Tax=Antarcticirhabdus aurantiaca TaxID=2606717 RepID=UPI00131BCB85|nr:hypothetical protein [Antarcticirhabdus aurantiaca]